MAVKHPAEATTPSQPPPAAHARLPGQVASGEYVGKACVAQQGLHGGFLIVAVFQQQPTAGIQVGGGAADDDAQVIQSVGAGRQGLRRLEAQVALLQVVVVGRDVGGVGDDQVEASGAGQRLPPAARVPVDAVGAQGLCIPLRHARRWRLVEAVEPSPDGLPAGQVPAPRRAARPLTLPQIVRRGRCRVQGDALVAELVLLDGQPPLTREQGLALKGVEIQVDRAMRPAWPT